MYQVINRNITVIGTPYVCTEGTLRHCLYYAAIMMGECATRHAVTAKQAYDAGYSIAKKKE